MSPSNKCSALQPSSLLFDGTLSRITSMWGVLILTVWFAYDNTLELAYVYLCPVLSSIVMALYPMSMSSAVLSWMMIAPYTLLRVVYTCLICTLVSHLIDSKGWTESQVRWIPFGWYAIMLLFTCQARSCRSNKMCYMILLSAQYTFFLAFFPLYNLATKGMTFISDANMIAILRLLVMKAETLPILPQDLIDFLRSLTHPECDHLFVPPATVDTISSSAMVYPNQSCHVPVPIFFRVLGGIFAGSSHHSMAVTTDADAQFISFNYRPGSEYFFDAAWYMKGSQGVFRGMLIAQIIALLLFTVYVCLKPTSRSQHLLKNKLIEVQRRLYKSATVIMEYMKVSSPAERVQERVCLMPLSQSLSLLGRTKFGNHFIKKYAPPSDLDNLHSRIQDLTGLVNFCHLESGLCQKPGLQSAPGLKGIQTALTHEAVMLSALARAVSGQTGFGRDIASDQTMWHHPIAQQIIMGDCQVIDLSADNRVCAADLDLMRNIFISYFRISQFVERSLSIDELWGRDAAVREQILELRHALQVELVAMLQYLKSLPPKSTTDITADLDHLVSTFGYGGVEKAKAGILYLEAESEKKLSTWFSSLMISTIGPAMIYSKGVMLGWKNVFNAGKSHPYSSPIGKFHDVDHCPSFSGKEDSDSASHFMSKNGSTPVLHNAEVWSGFRYWIGDLLIFGAYLFRIDDWAQYNFSKAQKDHMTDSKILGDSLSLSEGIVAAINKYVKPTNNGEGMDLNVIIIPELLWADVAMLKISKLVGWTFLGYLCSNLITYQGTVKRTCIRFSAMFLSTVLAWIVLFIALTQFGDSNSEPGPSDTISAFALENQSLRYWTYFFVTVVGCLLIAIGVTFFSNPFNRRYGFDPQFGYFGQIICYHFLVITLGLLGDPRQTRDELCICRILGHLIGSAVSVILSLIFFPSDANKQQQIRLANMTVAARRSFIALIYSTLYTVDADDASTQTTRDEWRKHLTEQLSNWQDEIDAYQSSFDDASIGDSLNILETDKKLAQMTDILKHKYFQRTATLRAVDNFKDDSSKVFEKDESFKEWLSTNSPLLDDKPQLPVHRDHSDLRLMRLRQAGLGIIRPVSPYAFFEDDSIEENAKITARKDSTRKVQTPSASPFTMASPFHDFQPVHRHSHISGHITTAENSETFEPETPTLGTISIMELAEAGNQMQTLWISIEQAIENLRRSNFNWSRWNSYTIDLIQKLQRRITTSFESKGLLDWPAHIIYKIWLDELTSIRRLVAYINEYTNNFQ